MSEKDQGFVTDDLVEIRETYSDLDGRKGVILGLSVDHIYKLWIVGLATPYEGPNGQTWRAVTIPGGCLARVREGER